MFSLRFTLGLAGALAISSCALVDRSMQKSSRKSSGGNTSFSAQQNEQPLNENTELKQQIRDLEKKMETRKEKEQYSKVLPWLKDDQEKVDFLKQPNLEKRNQWALENKIYARPQSPTPEMKKLIDNQDIGLGMPMDYVVKSWGEPTSKEASGNPLFRNERWRYVRNISSSDGYRQEKRYVYFESGKVVGWETD